MNHIASPFNTDRIAQTLAESLRKNLERVALATAGTDLLKDGQIELPVFFNLYFGAPPNSSAETRTDARRWFVTMGLKEGIDAIGPVVDDIRVIAGLGKMAREGEVLRAPRDMTVAELTAYLEHKETSGFHRLNWPDKFRCLADEFSIKSALELEFLSINRVRNCLTHRGGIVCEEDTKASDVDGALALYFRAVEIVVSMQDGSEHIAKPNFFCPPGSGVGARVSQRTLTFRRGDTITISLQDYAFILLTIHAFGKELIEAAIRYAKAAC